MPTWSASVLTLTIAALAVACGGRGGGLPDARGAEEDEHVCSGLAMGTSWRLRYRGGVAPAALARQVAARLEQIEAIFSTWRPDSVVSRINRGEDVAVPEAFRRVESFARGVHAASGGALDITVGRAVAAAGFAPPGAGPLDFSAVAKGFAVDEVGAMLERQGVREFLLELGGELLARGDRDWRVGLERAAPGVFGELRGTIRLRDAAIATSGTYRQRREGGATHLIDPAAGNPLGGELSAVSVVARDCLTADAWATALMVLGLERGLEVAAREGLAAQFVVRGASGDTVQRAVGGFPEVFTMPARGGR